MPAMTSPIVSFSEITRKYNQAPGFKDELKRHVVARRVDNIKRRIDI
jgi:hypothetical protein